ncbi:P-loop NTPase fold protein [Winogradskyella sp. UBA3174]|uniref:P-loop NTPase fold protein n=1 Tax=Winogradskyella sp. UBA3174 TaxID=1947785 RepID=UPI0025E8B956|nr:P-loop NTPase fold protein [Winogradskyella sp. UBA3174]|tara:strand:- start:138490 stop:141234 length:2745 start_codon:yes stop_codon:yes gene_type:complete
MKQFFKNNLAFIITYIITVGISLVFIKTITSSILKIGSNIDYTSNTFTIGFFALLILSIVLYSVLIRKAFIHNKRITFLVFYIATIYFFLRFIFTNYIEFLSLDNGFVYADWILIIAMLHVLNLVRVWAKDNRRKEKERDKKSEYEQTGISSGFFIEDKVFNNGEIDNEAILQKLITVVSDFKPEEAFSIGMNAVWGYGKSSFLHRFKNQYEKVQPNEIVFWYRIWKNKGSNAIIENFFDELKHQLKPYSAQISNDINNYVDSILSLSNSDLNKFISNGKELLSENETLENYYISINNNIKSIDKQIIILLDDLDRLESVEIINTLKLIRTLSDFSNVIFIAGYDRKYVVDSINKPKDNYLDKIFNVEINLLPFDSDLILAELFKHVDDVFLNKIEGKDVKGFNEAFKNLFRDLELSRDDITIDNFMGNDDSLCVTEHKLKYQDFLKTYRDVKRFVNEFKFNYSFLESEDDVVPHEYILLKLLTYKYRDLERLLFSDINYFLKRGIVDEVNKNIKVFGGDSLSNVFIYDKESKENLLKIISNYSKTDIDIIDGALCRLFSKKSIKFYQKSQNSISKIYYSEIYLRNNIVSGKLSITELLKAYSDKLMFPLAKRVSENSSKSHFHIVNEIKQFIFNNPASSKEQYLDLLRTLHFILPNSNTYDDQNSINILRDAFHKFYKKNKEEFLGDISKIIKQDSLSFLDFLFRDINLDLKRLKSQLNYGSDYKRYSNNEFSEEDLKMLLLSKLKFLIKNKSSPEIVRSVYFLHVEAIVYAKNILNSHESNSLLKNDIKKRFAEYFNSPLFESLREIVSETDFDLRNYSPNFSFAQIFSNRETLFALIEDPSNESLYNRFYKEGWDNFNSYLISLKLTKEDFKTIDKDKFENMKLLVQAFVDNEYKPLTKVKYDEVIGRLPI